jgi:hypothetical protein
VVIASEVGDDVATLDGQDSMKGLRACERPAARVDDLAAATPNLAGLTGVRDSEVRVLATHLNGLQQIIDADIEQTPRELGTHELVQLEPLNRQCIAQLMIERLAHRAPKLAHPILQLFRRQTVELARLLDAEATRQHQLHQR